MMDPHKRQTDQSKRRETKKKKQTTKTNQNAQNIQTCSANRIKGP